jgi:hypothetical protein
MTLQYRAGHDSIYGQQTNNQQLVKNKSRKQFYCLLPMHGPIKNNRTSFHLASFFLLFIWGRTWPEEVSYFKVAAVVRSMPNVTYKFIV